MFVVARIWDLVFMAGPPLFVCDLVRDAGPEDSFVRERVREAGPLDGLVVGRGDAGCEVRWPPSEVAVLREAAERGLLDVCLLATLGTDAGRERFSSRLLATLGTDAGREKVGACLLATLGTGTCGGSCW